MVFVQSAVGKKSVKGEDFCLVAEGLHWGDGSYASMLGYNIYAVFDGHGSQAVASYCRNEFLPVLRKHLDALFPVDVEENLVIESWQKALSDSLVATFSELDKYACQRFDKSGTTATVVIVCIDECMPSPLGGRTLVTVANVGDSNVYIDSGDTIYKFNEDHRLENNKCEQQRILASGGQVEKESPSDSLRLWPGGLMMSRTIGDKEALHAVPIPSIRSAALRIRKNLGGRLVLASDGLWDAVPAKTACTLVKKKKTSAAASYLVQEACKRAGKDRDDITIVVIDISSSKDIRPFEFLEISGSTTIKHNRNIEQNGYHPVIWNSIEDKMPNFENEREEFEEKLKAEEESTCDEIIAAQDVEFSDDKLHDEVQFGSENISSDEGLWQPVKSKRKKSIIKQDTPEESNNGVTDSSNEKSYKLESKVVSETGDCAAIALPLEEHTINEKQKIKGTPARLKCCYQYLKGRCNRGEKCRFSHSLEEAECTSSALVFAAPAPNSNLDASITEDVSPSSEPIRTYPQNARLDNSKNGICFRYQRGICKRGNACRFLHSEKMSGKKDPKLNEEKLSDISNQVDSSLYLQEEIKCNDQEKSFSDVNRKDRVVHKTGTNTRKLKQKEVKDSDPDLADYNDEGDHFVDSRMESNNSDVRHLSGGSTAKEMHLFVAGFSGKGHTKQILWEHLGRFTRVSDIYFRKGRPGKPTFALISLENPQDIPIVLNNDDARVLNGVKIKIKEYKKRSQGEAKDEA